MSDKSGRRLRVISFGAGAIGTYIGVSLAWKGHYVAFIEQPAVVELLQKQGLTLDFGKWTKQLGPPVTLNPSQVGLFGSLADALATCNKDGPFDVALFALKGFDTESVAQNVLKQHLAQLPPILCLQNGVENESKLICALGHEKVIYGSVGSAVGRRDAGNVVLEKYRGIGIGAGHPISQRLCEAFAEAKLNPKLYPRPLDMKWSKMLGNQLTSAVSAILDMTPMEVLQNNALYELEMAQLRETMAVMKSLDIRPIDLPGTPTGKLAFAVNVPRVLVQQILCRLGSESRGDKMPSFHIDLHAGRKQSEVEHLHGAVVRAGEKIGVPTPINKVLCETLLGMAEGRIPIKEFSKQPEKLLAMVDTNTRQPLMNQTFVLFLLTPIFLVLILILEYFVNKLG